MTLPWTCTGLKTLKVRPHVTSAGIRYSPTPGPEGLNCPFLTLRSIFNHEHVYVNCQQSASVGAVDFKFEDHKRWKRFLPKHDLPTSAARSNFELQVRSPSAALLLART